jgi:hypothetical protein
MPPRIALVTCRALPDLEQDDHPLVAALDDLGHVAVPAVWDDPAVAWPQFGAVVLRSPIDYVERLGEFLGWAAGVRRLHNGLPIVRWNTDKAYLRDLESHGLAVVPTRWLAPGEPLPGFDGGEVVVKPSVGVGATGVARYGDGERTAAERHVRRLHGEGQPAVLVQPYLASVQDAGEASLVYVEGAYSHAVRRTGFVPDGEVAPVAHEPSAPQRRLADRVVAHVTDAFATPLYARVDLLETPSGPAVNEVEVTDPILHLRSADGAAERLARAIVARLGAA